MSLQTRSLGTAALAFLLVAASASGQIKVGETLGIPDLRSLAQTPAKCPGDFVGRAILFEFFAYW